MSVLVLLIFASLAIATAFLTAFIWAVRSGQYEDTCTPSMRLLVEDAAASVFRNDPPSPRPSPPGEGETRSALGVLNGSQMFGGATAAITKRGDEAERNRTIQGLPGVLPLPGGEGRGEGECSSEFSIPNDSTHP